MIRITVRAQTPTEVVLQIEGTISEETADVLQAEGERWMSHKDLLVLDLAGVRSIDAAGIALLRGWLERPRALTAELEACRVGESAGGTGRGGLQRLRTVPAEFHPLGILASAPGAVHSPSSVATRSACPTVPIPV